MVSPISMEKRERDGRNTVNRDTRKNVLKKTETESRKGNKGSIETGKYIRQVTEFRLPHPPVVFLARRGRESAYSIVGNAGEAFI